MKLLTACFALSKGQCDAEAERKDNDIRIRVTTEEKEAFNEAAKKQGRELSNWLRFVANEAAGTGRGEK